MKRSGPVERLSVGLALDSREIVVGTLAWSLARRVAAFAYDPDFVEERLEISPVTLRLGTGVTLAPRHPFEGLHGVFADSLPDGWGRLLIDRQVRAAGGDPAALSPLDRLALVGRAGMGALTYRPDTFGKRKAGVPDLDGLAKDAAAVLEGDASVDIERLVGANGGSAGARPKAMILRDRTTGRLRLDVGQPRRGAEDAWLVKFRSRQDAETVGRVEHAYALMASAAGLDFPQTLVLEGGSGAGYFAARRFDRTASGRRHIHTLSGMVGADHRMPSVDYGDYLQATKLVTGSAAPVEEAFRRMVFNILCGNRDDHAKNHAFAMSNEDIWTLAPAFDVTLSDGPGGEHAMAVAGEGRAPTRRDIARVAKRAALSETAYGAIVDQVVAGVRTWPLQAGIAGVPDRDIARIGMVLTALEAWVMGVVRARS